MKKVVVEKAQAFEIEKDKQYIVAFESDMEMPQEDVALVQSQILKIFTDLGAKVEVIVTINGRMNISEVKE